MWQDQILIRVGHIQLFFRYSFIFFLNFLTSGSVVKEEGSVL